MNSIPILDEHNYDSAPVGKLEFANTNEAKLAYKMLKAGQLEFDVGYLTDDEGNFLELLEVSLVHKLKPMAVKGTSKVAEPVEPSKKPGTKNRWL